MRSLRITQASLVRGDTGAASLENNLVYLLKLTFTKPYDPAILFPPSTQKKCMRLFKAALIKIGKTWKCPISIRE